MAKFYKGILVRDNFFYLPEMGMYWRMSLIKRNIPGENESGLNMRIDQINDDLAEEGEKKIGEYVWHPTLMLNKTQLAKLPENWQVSFHPKVWFMIVDTSWSPSNQNQLPDAGVWRPVDFVWVSNKEVYIKEFNGSLMNTANWLGHRFPIAKDTDILKAPIPSGSLPSIDGANAGGDTGGNTGGNTGGDTGGDTGGNTGGIATDITIHIKCPNCGHKIF